MAHINKTFHGSEKDLGNGQIHIKEFKFTPEDIGKFIVVKFRYEEHLFWCPRLTINHNELSTRNDDYLYGVYQIDWHNDYQKSQNSVEYKIKLTPVKSLKAWCPNRSWYTSDMESLINREYNLFDENPLFDNEDEAINFAMKKNFELYPDNRSWWTKIIDKIFNK